MNETTARKTAFVIFAVLTVLWAAFIFSRSAKNSEQSGSESQQFTETIVKIIAPNYEALSEEQKTAVVDSLDAVIRKLAHMFIYAVLAVLSSCALLARRHTEKPKNKLLQSLIFCILYAVTDEFHQLFVPGRAGMIRDVFIDSSGAIIGLLFVFTTYTAVLKCRKSEA